ncbi:unnamed protein product [Acanthoscelides obtectus]|uniref:DDE Tnp4 domain-containing protein n=1 Tax=Acanthoscelides obtectus TaxID=200917 RepID=A0A9P0KVP5_ACAOB|nr:unnamed protein product [Acanthoscelides obtectus]CAK1678233.1 Protein ANTAGONIST OF LIKE HETEROCHROMATIN PROTEIN 1 [Acanthoscelides obtectus]
MNLSQSDLLLTAAVTCCVLIYQLTKNKLGSRKRSQWTKKWLQRKKGRGTLALLNRELRVEDTNAYRNFLRLDDTQFDYLLALVEPHIKKEDTFMRESISAQHRLDVTLRFLATGETYRSLMYSTRIHESTISKIVPETCLALCRCLKDVYLKNPTTDDWLKVAADFQSKWNFPNCLGALDGRHIAFSPPTSAGSYYHNYKGTDSMVLLALVDANYKFIYVNIGVNGRISDGSSVLVDFIKECKTRHLICHQTELFLLQPHLLSHCPLFGQALRQHIPQRSG